VPPLHSAAHNKVKNICATHKNQWDFSGIGGKQRGNTQGLLNLLETLRS
jgi:hypothetical protein